ncbi:MAG: alcohol dehydrogenase catalytic domain-containing protein [Streptomyces sp.]|nr:alcohol dehydrogenase catalytic domain-containing protein [Streptomyces sp.]
MRAVRFLGPGKPFEVEDVPVPAPGPGEVLVRVHACGVCASELHLKAGWFPTRADGPLTPGHEPAGEVADVGPGVRRWLPGDRVAVIFAGRACGECAACRAGRPADDCAVPLLMGMDLDGAWAEYVVVPERALIRLPEDIPFEIGALLTDAVATPFNALVEVGGMRLGERVAVFGIGGLGVHAVRLARLAGASFVAAVDPRPGARARAARYGADVVIDPARHAPSEVIYEVTGDRGVDLALECAGTNDALSEAVASLGPDGRCVLVGVGQDPVSLGPSMAFSALRTTLRGAMTYRPEHYRTLLDLVVSDRLDLTESISVRLTLERVNEAVELLEDKAGDPVRVMLIP